MRIINEAKCYNERPDPCFWFDPYFWALTEFCSAISIKLRTGQLSETHAKRAHKEFDSFATGGLRLVPATRASFRQAAEMVKQQQYGLRAGDALHLAVALERVQAIWPRWMKLWSRMRNAKDWR